MVLNLRKKLVCFRFSYILFCGFETEEEAKRHNWPYRNSIYYAQWVDKTFIHF